MVNLLSISLRFLLEVVFYIILLPIKIFLILRLGMLSVYLKLRYDVSFKDTWEIDREIILASFKREVYWVKYNQIKSLDFFMNEEER